MITELSASELRELMPNLESGMVPKMEACLRAVEGGLTRATVVDGRVPHALLWRSSNVGIGTMVTQDGLVRLGSRVFPRDEGIPPHEYGNGDFGPVLMSKGDDPLDPAPRAQGQRGCGHDGRPDDGKSRAVRLGILGRGAGGVFRICDEYLRCAEARVRSRRGLLPLGRRGPEVPRICSLVSRSMRSATHIRLCCRQLPVDCTLGHVSNFFATPAQVALAERLSSMTGGAEARVFFTNSGTEANEAAFKITRMTGRSKIISTEGAFHGRSMGALALTHNEKYRIPLSRCLAR